jgi:hypothetical protein
VLYHFGREVLLAKSNLLTNAYGEML